MYYVLLVAYTSSFEVIHVEVIRRCRDDDEVMNNDLDDVRMMSRDSSPSWAAGECPCFTSLSFQRLIVSSLPLPCLMP